MTYAMHSIDLSHIRTYPYTHDYIQYYMVRPQRSCDMPGNMPAAAASNAGIVWYHTECAVDSIQYTVFENAIFGIQCIEHVVYGM